MSWVELARIFLIHLLFYHNRLKIICSWKHLKKQDKRDQEAGTKLELSYGKRLFTKKIWKCLALKYCLLPLLRHDLWLLTDNWNNHMFKEQQKEASPGSVWEIIFETQILGIQILLRDAENELNIIRTDSLKWIVVVAK